MKLCHEVLVVGLYICTCLRLQQVQSKIWGLAGCDLFASNNAKDSSRKEVIVGKNLGRRGRFNGLPKRIFFLDRNY